MRIKKKKMGEADKQDYVMVKVSPDQFSKIHRVSEVSNLYISEMVREWIDSLPDPDQEGAA
jgi:hypothetical protein